MRTESIIFALLILGVFNVPAQEPARSGAMSTGRATISQDIAIQATIFTLPKDQAMLFIARHHLNDDAGTGIKDLQTLVAEKKATGDASLAFTAESGNHETLNQLGKAIKLEVEPVESPDGTVIDANMMLSYGASSKVSTTFSVRTGAVKFLGAFDAAKSNQNVTYLVFVRLTTVR